MAKRPNCGFQKRQKDMEKQKKREEKAAKKRAKKAAVEDTAFPRDPAKREDEGPPDSV